MKAMLRKAELRPRTSQVHLIKFYFTNDTEPVNYELQFNDSYFIKQLVPGSYLLLVIVLVTKLAQLK